MTLREVFSLTLNEEEIGYIGTVDGYRISVEGSEGTIPHIHCVKGDPRHPEKVSCIALKEVGYANHSEYHTTLDRKTFRHVCEFLANGVANKTNINAWLKSVYDWNEANSGKEQIIPSGFVSPYNNEIIYKEQ
jgi:hypothetical protein